MRPHLFPLSIQSIDYMPETVKIKDFGLMHVRIMCWWGRLLFNPELALACAAINQLVRVVWSLGARWSISVAFVSLYVYRLLRYMVIMNWECRCDLCRGFRAKDIVICIYIDHLLETARYYNIIDRQAFPTFPLQTVWGESAFAMTCYLSSKVCKVKELFKRSLITSSALASTETYRTFKILPSAVRAELQQKLTL